MGKLNIHLPSLGLAVDKPAEYIDSRAAVNIKNIEFNRNILRKRVGTAPLGSTLGERIQRLFELRVGIETRMFRVGLTDVEVYNKTTNVWTSVATADLTGTDADPVDVAFPVLAGEAVAVYTNNIDAIKKCRIAGMDAVLGGSPPKCKYLQAFGPYLVLLNVTDVGTNFPNRVQWCDTGNPESWTPGGASNAGSIDLLDDSEGITGRGMFGAYITVHKPRSIYLGQFVSTSSVINFSRRATGIGAAAAATILNLPTGDRWDPSVQRHNGPANRVSGSGRIA